MSFATQQLARPGGRHLAAPPGTEGDYEQLLHAYTALGEELQGRTLALASAAHELKTPLSVLSGYLEILLSGKLGPLNGRQRQVLKAMQGSGLRLQRFVQDFLTYTSLETGTLTIQLERADLNACLRELHEIWLPGFQDKEIVLGLATSPELPLFRFDHHKLQRVISNLLENAHRCTPAGGSVWIRAEPYSWDRRVHQLGGCGRDRRKRSSTEPNAARINVCDTGPGIAPEFHQEIFEDFVTLGQSGTVQNTGLGLAIARRLMQVQHGKIWVESELGAGSRFSLLLPLNRSNFTDQ